MLARKWLFFSNRSIVFKTSKYFRISAQDNGVSAKNCGDFSFCLPEAEILLHIIIIKRKKAPKPLFEDRTNLKQGLL